ncbi:MAG: hypothetical protein ACNYPE_12505 [Candidatus Azotimanducaceae bacterium WSBS_2022_MAG_OTU7]
MPREIYLVKVGMSMTVGMYPNGLFPMVPMLRRASLFLRITLETEKVNLDVDSEYDGTVKHLVEAGVT